MTTSSTVCRSDAWLILTTFVYLHRSEDVLRSITSRELAFALQVLKDHTDYDEIHSTLLKICHTHDTPRNIIPKKVRQLEDSAIYIGTICPENCCLQVMAKRTATAEEVPNAETCSVIRRASETAVTQSDTSPARVSEVRHVRSSSAPTSRYMWRTNSNE